MDREVENDHYILAEDLNGNWSEEDYLEKSNNGSEFFMDNPLEMLSPTVRNPLFYHIVITYSITFFVGLLGNIIAIMVIIGERKNRNGTNLFLVSLAIADILLLLICIPLSTIEYFTFRWDKEGTVCKMANYVELLSATASIINLCAVTLERFVVIVFPMRSRSLCTISNCRRAIVVVWFIAILLSIPVIFSKDIFKMTYFNDEIRVTLYYCYEMTWELEMAVYQLVILLVIPGLLILICYTMVIKELWKSTKNINLLTNPSSLIKAPRRGMNRKPWKSFGFGRCNKSKREAAAAASETDAFSMDKNWHQDQENQSRKNGSGLLTPSGSRRKSTKPKILGSSNGQQPQQSSASGGKHLQGILVTSGVPSRHARPGSVVLQAHGRSSKGDEAKKARKQVIKMLILVVILFILSWGPKLIMSVCLKTMDVTYSQDAYILRVIFNLIPYIHSCLNPCIYGCMSKNFRRAMKRQLLRCFSCGFRGDNSRNLETRSSAMPLHSTVRVRTPQGVDSLYTHNNLHPTNNLVSGKRNPHSSMDVDSRPTEVETISTAM